MLVTHPYARSQYPPSMPVTHLCVSWLTDIEMETLDNYDILLIDEAQFYEGLADFVMWSSEVKKKIVYASGLDGDYRRRKFGEILNCIPLADTVERLTAFCTLCADGTAGLFTYRLNPAVDGKVVPGGEEMYTTLCRRCYLGRTDASP